MIRRDIKLAVAQVQRINTLTEQGLDLVGYLPGLTTADRPALGNRIGTIYASTGTAPLRLKVAHAPFPQVTGVIHELPRNGQIQLPGWSGWIDDDLPGLVTVHQPRERPVLPAPLQPAKELQQDFLASKISKEDYQARYNQLQVELLQAQLNIDIGTLNKLISAPGFSDIRSDLERLKDEAQPLIDEMNKLVQTVQTGVVDPQEFQSRYTEVKNAFTQLDQLLTKAATSKIVEAANKVAVENGYDLVLRAKNVIIYRNTAKLTDITDQVKHELASYLKQ